MNIGDSFGSWVVVGLLPHTPGNDAKRKVLVRCVCGTERPIRISILVRGRSRSCGCARRKHGLSDSAIYGVWLRLHIAKALCEAWDADAAAFAAYVATLPGYGEPRSWLERVDSSLPAAEGNVRWRKEKDGKLSGTVLYGRWKAAKAHGNLCDAWAADYRVFEAAVTALPGYGVAGARLRKSVLKQPLGPGNAEWKRKTGRSWTPNPFYARWSSAKAAGALCPEWLEFAAFVADVSALPGCNPTARLRRISKKRPFSKDNVQWVRTLSTTGGHPLAQRWRNAKADKVLCPEWAASFDEFVKYVEALPGYTVGARLSRIKTRFTYRPGNVHWKKI